MLRCQGVKYFSTRASQKVVSVIQKAAQGEHPGLENLCLYQKKDTPSTKVLTTFHLEEEVMVNKKCA